MTSSSGRSWRLSAQNSGAILTDVFPEKERQINTRVHCRLRVPLRGWSKSCWGEMIASRGLSLA